MDVARQEDLRNAVRVSHEKPEQLLFEWLDWWVNFEEAPLRMPKDLHIRTADYLRTEFSVERQRMKSQKD